MGCVLGTRAAGERASRRKQKLGARRNSETVAVTGASRRKQKLGARRNSETVAVTGPNGSVERGKGKKIEDAAAAITTATSAPPGFRLNRGVSTGAEGWPSWLNDVAGDAVKDWKPRRANTFEKLDKIGQGTYSNVYKAKDLITGKVVALKKVRFDSLEPEAVKFMAREILVLRKLDHPNVIKLEGLAVSRMSSSLYLVFEYMEHDLAGLSSVQSVKFTEPQAKCYMKQLLSGLEHCHNNGVLHRDIKSSNLLIDNEGILKIADFGLASFFDPECKRPMTSRVVTLWYRPPELLLGATQYSVGVDLWSAGCILAELFAGKPILRGRTEVEQLHKIFKLCGSPTEAYWKKSRLPNANIYKPQQPYKRCIADAFKDFPPSALALVETLLAIQPDARGTATAALNSEFFTTEPYSCEPSSLPTFPPSKELDIKLRDEEARRRQRASGAKPHALDGNRRARARSRAIPAPEANAELQPNLDRLRIMSNANPKSKSEKFPPPHQDGSVGNQSGPVSFSAVDTSSTSSIFDHRSSPASTSKSNKKEPRRGPRRFINALYPSSVGWDFGFSRRRTVSENFKDRR